MRIKWGDTFRLIDSLTKAMGQSDLSMGKNQHKELLIGRGERGTGQWQRLWDLAQVINTGVLHEGAIPLCVYTVRHSAKISYCTAALVLSVNAGQHSRGWPGISHTDTHTHKDVNAQIRLRLWLEMLQFLETDCFPQVFFFFFFFFITQKTTNRLFWETLWLAHSRQEVLERAIPFFSNYFFGLYMALLIVQLKMWQETGWEWGGLTCSKWPKAGNRTQLRCSEDKASKRHP